AVLDVLSAEYILTARAKGLRETRVIGKHTLRNSAIPIVTLAGLEAGQVLGGAVITETIFAWPGRGRLTVQALLNRDFPIVLAAAIPAAVGGVLGLVAGFVERWTAALLMRLADVQLSFPFILLAMTINAIVGLGLRNIILSLSAAGWVVYARVVRGEVLSVKQ